jgi:radical SAM superfamily enzyme YgiQ (UPF0313 family)
MARISLVYPSDGECYKFSRAVTRRLPLGIGYIAAALERADHEVMITDASLNNLSIEQTIERALSNDPQFVGVGFTTPVYHRAKEIMAGVKRRSPGTIGFFGGPHASALPKATLMTSAADIICIGEAEESVVGAIDVATRNGDLGTVPGIMYRWNGQEGRTQDYRLRLFQPRNETAKAIDLNIIPEPARHLFDESGYVDHARGVNDPQSSAMFSRGCPGKCGFCGAADTLVRWRNLDNVLAELHGLQDRGISNVFVMDDTYTNNRPRVLELSRRIVEEGLSKDMTLRVQLRLDQVDEEICDALYNSGVRYVGPGIESGNEQIMKAIGKGPHETKTHIMKKIAMLKKYDWRVRCSYVMGMPDETEAQMLETISFAQDIYENPGVATMENAFTILVPYPDSPLWHVAVERGLVDENMDFSKFLYYQSIFRDDRNLSTVPNERLMELHEFAYHHVGNKNYALAEGALGAGVRSDVPRSAITGTGQDHLKTVFEEFRSAMKPADKLYDDSERRYDSTRK